MPRRRLHPTLSDIASFKSLNPNMVKFILAINAGSSSVKIGVYKRWQSAEPPEKVYSAQVSSISTPPATFSCNGGSGNIQDDKLGQDIKSQEDAFRYILDHLVSDPGLPEIEKRETITTTCHRVVHGGDYKDATVITQETYHHLELLTDLAPLHNASALAIVKSCIKELPHAKNIAYFDSSFHHTLPEHIRTYPINQEVAKSKKLRKYGFHGISYAFILRSVAKHLGKVEKDTSIIALHLGSGASACAIKDGESLDTS
jgi:acetate kinase